MEGRVKVFLTDRRFGFVEFCEPGAEIVDQSIFFNGTGLVENVQSNDYVSFDIELDDERRPRATNVRRITDYAPVLGRRLHGTVAQFNDDGKHYGFIRNADDAGKRKRIFFHAAEVLPAEDGQTYEPIPGCTVEFEIGLRHEKPSAVGIVIVEWPALTFEERFAAAEELPLSVPEPVAVSSSVLSPATRHLSLQEIRKRRKSSAPLPA